MNTNESAFKQVGNLAFYDDWNMNYVYFQSLLKAEELFSFGNPKLAKKISQKAIDDAQIHSTFGTQIEHETYFQEQFNKIIAFLEQAIAYEKSNELAYFQQKEKDYKEKFPDWVKSKTLTKLFQILDNAKKGDFDYTTFIEIINILQSGLKNAKVIFDYEADRIQKIDALVTKALNSRESQTKGLLGYHQKSQEDIIKGATRSRERLKRKITLEYAKTGQLTRKENDRFVLYGGAQIERTVPKAIDRVLASWVEDVMARITSEKKFLDEILEKMQVEYPYNGNFKLLEHQVQQRIILAVAQLGTQQLKTVLTKELNDALVEKLVKRISNDSPFLDMTQNIKISGLKDNNFGLVLSDTKLFESATTTDKLLTNSGKELYSRITRTLENTKDNNTTLLSEVLDNATTSVVTPTGKINQNANKVINDIIESIQLIEKIKQESDQFLEEWNKELKKKTPRLLAAEKQSSVSANVTLKIKNNQVIIEGFDNLQKELGGTAGFQALGFKNFNPQSIATMVGTLKRQASIKLKTIIADSINQYLNSALNQFSESYLVSTIGRETSNTIVKIDGPKLAELLPGLQLVTSGKNYYFDWNNYKGKNDSVTIAFNHSVLKKRLLENLGQQVNLKSIMKIIEEGLNHELGDARNEFLDVVQKELNARIQTATTTGQENKYSKTATDYLTIIDHINDQSEDIKKAYQKFLRYIRRWLKKKGIDDKETRMAISKALRNSINDSFYISNTTKSANDYANFLGVKGGTLGNAGFLTQFARIQDIFLNAGIPIDPELADWMQSAILNCFPGSVVGEKNKSVIEKYLGSLMAFALFDEGGAEGQVIDNISKEIFQEIHSKKKTSSKNFLHLYLVDSIYYPGSFVLQRTLDEIKGTVLQNLQQVEEISRKGAGILIVNPASETLIGNRPIKDTENPDPAVWLKTGEAVKSKITLQILFLAGLMDIVQSINEKLSQIII